MRNGRRWHRFSDDSSPYAGMADIGQVRTTPFPWPTTAQTIKPSGQQQRQPEKQYKPKDEHDDHEDDNGDTHIDEYA